MLLFYTEINDKKELTITINGDEDITKDKNGLLISSSLACSSKTICKLLSNFEIDSTDLNFIPFADECKTLTIGNLTFENRVDKVVVYGSLILSDNKEEDYNNAVKLNKIFNLIFDILDNTKELPIMITIKETEIVKNPFAII